MLNVLLCLVFYSGGFGGFGGWGSGHNVENLNDKFREYGISELGSYQFGFGGCGYGIISNVLIGGGGFGSSQTVYSANVKVKANYGGGWFEIGYLVLTKSRLFFAPSFGIGGVGYSFTFYPPTGDVPFDSLLKDPKRFSSVSISAGAVYPCVNALVWISNFAGILFKVGYVITFARDWKMDDGKNVLNPPDFKPDGIVGTITVVFGGGSSAE